MLSRARAIYLERVLSKTRYFDIYISHLCLLILNSGPRFAWNRRICKRETRSIILFYMDFRFSMRSDVHPTPPVLSARNEVYNCSIPSLRMMTLIIYVKIIEIGYVVHINYLCLLILKITATFFNFFFLITS